MLEKIAALDLTGVIGGEPLAEVAAIGNVSDPTVDRHQTAIELACLVEIFHVEGQCRAWANVPAQGW